MSLPPPQPLVDLARRMLLNEAATAEDAGDLATGLQRVCRALHARLSPLISSAGFHALFARAITIAARDFPFLATLRVAAENGCTLRGLSDAPGARNASEVADAFTAVLAHFIWLLVIFIGENLGLRTVRELWPELHSGKDSSSGAEG